MGRKLLALLVFVQSLSSGSWAVGIGGGSSHYLARQYPSSYRFEDLSAIETGWRVEAEAGYYAGREGFNIMAVYGETFWRSQSRQTLFRDQHLGLLGGKAPCRALWAWDLRFAASAITFRRRRPTILSDSILTPGLQDFSSYQDTSCFALRPPTPSRR
jgi:hypothetical protein